MKKRKMNDDKITVKLIYCAKILKTQKKEVMKKGIKNEKTKKLENGQNNKIP